MAQENGQGSIKFDTISQSFDGPLKISGFWADCKAAAKTVTLKDDADKIVFKFTSTAEQVNGGIGGLCLRVSKIYVSTLTDAAEVIVYHE